MGRIDLGLSESEFWDLTPRQFRALLDRQREIRERIEQRADLRAGVIASVIANSAGGKRGGGSFKATDFFRFPPVGRPIASARPEKMPQKMVEQLWINWSKAAGAQVPQELLVR